MMYDSDTIWLRFLIEQLSHITNDLCHENTIHVHPIHYVSCIQYHIYSFLTYLHNILFFCNNILKLQKYCKRKTTAKCKEMTTSFVYIFVQIINQYKIRYTYNIYNLNMNRGSNRL